MFAGQVGKDLPALQLSRIEKEDVMKFINPNEHAVYLTKKDGTEIRVEPYARINQNHPEKSIFIVEGEEFLPHVQRRALTELKEAPAAAPKTSPKPIVEASAPAPAPAPAVTQQSVEDVANPESVASDKDGTSSDNIPSSTKARKNRRKE